MGEQLGAQNHAVEFGLDTQTSELEGRLNRHKNVRLCVRSDCAGNFTGATLDFRFL